MTQAHFTSTKLAGDDYLVAGTDVHGNSGKVVLDGSDWNAVLAARATDVALEAFDAKVTEFFRPLTEAAEELKAAREAAAQGDELFRVVITKGTKGTPAQEEQVVHLDTSGAILRLIDEGRFDRLLWVGDQLVITAEPVVSPRAGLYDLPQEEDSDS